MKNYFTMKRKLKPNLFRIRGIILLILVLASAKRVQAETYDITLSQFHPTGDYAYSVGGLSDNYFESIYPCENRLDYKKFMKYTYKISDDSVIGLKANTTTNSASVLLPDANGKIHTYKPYNIAVYALAPGKATLTVYDGNKLIDKFNYTVAADTAISPSSYVDLTGDKVGNHISYTDKKTTEITKADIKKENDLIKKFAKAAANSKYTTTNQRIYAALNAVINHGATQIYYKKYDELKYQAWKKGISFSGKYNTAHAMLIEKKSLSKGFAIVNKAVLSNLGFDCITYTYNESELNYGCETWNYVKIFNQYEEEDKDSDDDVTGDLTSFGFGAAAKLESEYDFSSKDAESVYRKTHLPAWLIGEDTKRQTLSAGQTIQLSESDLNNNIYSSDTSVVTVQNGKITGVNPGVAVVYRYNDTYCDVFYVLVKKKGSAKTIQSKIYTKTTKSYFSSSDYSPYIRGGQAGPQSEPDRIKDWEAFRIFDLEPALGNGSKLTTKYSEGKIECYLTENGESTLLCTIGSGD